MVPILARLLFGPLSYYGLLYHYVLITGGIKAWFSVNTNRIKTVWSIPILVALMKCSTDM